MDITELKNEVEKIGREFNIKFNINSEKEVSILLYSMKESKERNAARGERKAEATKRFAAREETIRNYCEVAGLKTREVKI